MKRHWTVFATALCLLTAWSVCGARAASAQTAAPAKAPSALGTVKAIQDKTLTLSTDAGAELHVTVAADTRLLRVPPGSKDLKEASPLAFGDIQVGDRVLVRYNCPTDPNACAAVSVIAMKKEDIAQKQAKEREEWQRHGIGGLVKSVDASDGLVKISVASAAGTNEVEVHVGKSTVLRRYAPGSVKFDDAKPSSLAEIQPGDQLRARGTRSEDGLSFTADEIVSGAFLNLSGTIASLDAGAGTMTINDLTTKKSVVVKITGDSQIRKLPPFVAQRIAVRLKGGPDAAGGDAKPAAPSTAPATPAPTGGAPSGAGWQGGLGGQRPGGGNGDLQQMLSRLPASTLGDFQKGDAVLIVATSASGGGQAVAITLLGGVEPILQASPQGGGSSILTPWSLSSGGDTGGQ